jgi:hypothetical protein
MSPVLTAAPGTAREERETREEGDSEADDIVRVPAQLGVEGVQTMRHSDATRVETVAVVL